MPTEAEVDEFHAETVNVGTLAVSGLVSYWTTSTLTPSVEQVGEVRDVMAGLVSEYAQAAASVAVDFYSSVRPVGAPRFNPAPVVREDLLTGPSANWATKPLLDDDMDAALERIAAEIMNDVTAAAIESLGQATEDDPLDVRFARFPGNPDPCAYCVLRAGKGAVYWSEETATRGDHNHCGCKATPVFPDEPLPFERAPYEAQYLNGAEAAQSTVEAIRNDSSLTSSERREREFKALLAGMRAANGLR